MDVLMLLQIYNLFHCNIFINYAMLKTIFNKFIFKNIFSIIIIINQNFMKCERYKIDLGSNNDKNNLHYIVEFASLNNQGFLSNYININIDKAR